MGKKTETHDTMGLEKQERVGVMSILLFHDLLQNVCNFCTPIDLIVLQRTSKDIRTQEAPITKSMIKNFKSNITIMLSNCGYEHLSQSNLLCRDDCILSGSIVLHAILGKELIGSDIDMYASENSVPKIRQHLSSMGYYRVGWPDHLEPDDEDEYVLSKVGPRLESLEAWLSNAPKTNAWRDSTGTRYVGIFVNRASMLCS